MSRLNFAPKREVVYNHEGAATTKKSNEYQLVRMVLAHMLWENQFYVDGQVSANIVENLVRKVDPEFAADLALRARTEFKLRHVPLLILATMARAGTLKAQHLEAVIQRADEMAEFLAVYWKDGKQPIPNQAKKGLAACFNKFNEYQLAKWDKRNSSISMRDVMFLVHPKPRNFTQVDLFKRLANKQLQTPDTWEVALSGGADKKETFERLMYENNLGGLAFLRNLRNMTEVGVSDTLIRAYAKTVDWERTLPFRFVSAAKIVPQYEDMLEEAMFSSLENVEKLKGKTVLLVDVSGSMFYRSVSSKSDLTRFDAAAALAMLSREICEKVDIFTFSDGIVHVPPRRGFGLREALYNSQAHGGTNLRHALNIINEKVNYDRIIVFTDGESSSGIANPKTDKGYILNIASYQNSIATRNWVEITGFSEAVLDYVKMVENLN